MSDKLDIPDEIELLLPWYAAGTLNERELAQVETYLANNPHVHDQLDLIEDEIGASIHANEAIDGPPAGALDRLMSQIESEGAGPRQSTNAMQDRISQWLSELAGSFGSPVMKAAGALAALVIVVQGVALGGLLLGSDDGTKFVPASGGEHVVTPSGPAFLVKFAPNASAADITRILDASKLRIVDGPKPGGIFRVAMAPDDKADAKNVLTKLKLETTIVVFAAPAERQDAK